MQQESQRIHFQIIVEEKNNHCFHLYGFFKQPLELQMMQTSLLILLSVGWDRVYGLSIFSPNVLQISPQSTGDSLISEKNRRIDILKFSFSGHGCVISR